MTSLFERLGGEAAVTAAVTEFYARVLADPLLAPFFAGISTSALIQKQIAFMMMAFGGPHRYTGRDLAAAHAPLVARGLGDPHFDAVAGHLAGTLDDLGISADLRDEALTIVATTRSAVLGREDAPAPA